jgi:hypothetical protein
MAIPPLKGLSPPTRAVRYWMPKGGFSQSIVPSTHATAPSVGTNPPAPRPIMGSDTQLVTVRCPAMIAGDAKDVTGTVVFPNIAPFTTGAKDRTLFHVYPVHIVNLPPGVSATVINVLPRSFQAKSGPAIAPNEGAPNANTVPQTGLSPGVNYQSFSADVTLRFQNCEAVSTVGSDVSVQLGAHIINQTG